MPWPRSGTDSDGIVLVQQIHDIEREREIDDIVLKIDENSIDLKEYMHGKKNKLYVYVCNYCKNNISVLYQF